jgi:hypothetical protein
MRQVIAAIARALADGAPVTLRRLPGGQTYPPALAVDVGTGAGSFTRYHFPDAPERTLVHIAIDYCMNRHIVVSNDIAGPALAYLSGMGSGALAARTHGDHTVIHFNSERGEG